jgi:AcrR family transcriptional regulator
VGRQTVYRVFATRKLLLEAIITERLSELAARIRPIVSRYKTLEDAVIQGSIRSVEMSRADEVYISVLNEIDHLGAERYMISSDSPMQRFMLLVWQDALAAARFRRELRDDLTDVDIVDWLRGVHTILFIREDLDAREVGRFMKNFVMPGLVRPTQAKSA